MVLCWSHLTTKSFPHSPYEHQCCVSSLLANSRSAATWFFLNIVLFCVTLLYRPVLSRALDMLSGAPSAPELCSPFKVFVCLSVASITSLLLVCAENVVEEPCLDSAWLVWYSFHLLNQQCPLGQPNTAIISNCYVLFAQIMHLFLHILFSHYFHLYNLIHRLNNAPTTVGVFDEEYVQVILMIHR